MSSFKNNYSSHYHGLPESVMQNMAMEMNISETAFVRPLKPGDTFEKGTKINSINEQDSISLTLRDNTDHSPHPYSWSGKGGFPALPWPGGGGGWVASIRTDPSAWKEGGLLPACSGPLWDRHHLSPILPPHLPPPPPPLAYYLILLHLR